MEISVSNNLIGGKSTNAYERLFKDKLTTTILKHLEIPRMRVGKRQTIETLISEEALLLAKFLRNERKEWIPRIDITSDNWRDQKTTKRTNIKEATEQ